MHHPLLRKYFRYLSFFYSYLGPRIWVLIALSMLVGIFDGFGLAMFVPLFEMVGGQGEGAGTESLGQLKFLVTGLNRLGIQLNLNTLLFVVFAFFAIKGVFKFLENYYKVRLRMLFVRRTRFGLLDGLAELRYEAFASQDAGRIQNTLSGETHRLTIAFFHYFSMLQYVILLPVYIGLAFLGNSQFAILVAAGALLTNLFYRSLYRLTEKLSRNVTTANHDFQGLLIQVVEHFKYLKATARMEHYNRKLKRSVNEIEGIEHRIGFFNALMMSSREALAIAVVVVVILVQVNFLGGKLSSIILSLLFFYRALNALMSVQTYWNSFLGLSGSIDNMQQFRSFLRSNQEIRRETAPAPSGEALYEARGIHYSYPSRPNVLSDIRFDLLRNKTIAFVGESGSGKTSLINILAGLLDSYEGDMRINGLEMRQFDVRQYQQRIGYITQEPVIFNDSIYNNVTFWAPETEENIRRFDEAIHKSALGEFISQLPDREHARLGNNGVLISGGQKQRISIARELYRKADVLFLDEATSSLDSETERVIQQNLDELKGHHTIIMIAHRISTVRNADVIYVLNRGKIVAAGTFEELVVGNSQFRKMAQLQEF